MNKFKLNKIRRIILESLYIQSRKCSSYVKLEFLIKSNKRIDKKDILKQIDYLNIKGYVKTNQINDGSIIFDEIKITSKGSNLIENESNLNSEFPVEYEKK